MPPATNRTNYTKILPLELTTQPPAQVEAREHEHVITLMTESGGHVGWGVGWRPWRRRWEYTNNLVTSFAEGLCAAAESETRGS